jgi:hypothetical protein
VCSISVAGFETSAVSKHSYRGRHSNSSDGGDLLAVMDERIDSQGLLRRHAAMTSENQAVRFLVMIATSTQRALTGALLVRGGGSRATRGRDAGPLPERASCRRTGRSSPLSLTHARGTVRLAPRCMVHLCCAAWRSDSPPVRSRLVSTCVAVVVWRKCDATETRRLRRASSRKQTIATRRRRSGTDLTFHLREPDRDFLYKLALPYAFAVPAVARPRTVCRSLRTGTASEAATLPPCGGGCVGAPPSVSANDDLLRFAAINGGSNEGEPNGC